MIKKFLVFLLVFLLCSSICIVPASAMVMADSNFTYEVSFSNNEAVITKCLTNESSITVPSHFMDYKITGIKSYAFENNQNLTSIALPMTIQSVDSYAFRNCKSLRYITIPESVTKLGEGVCSGCSSLEKAYVKTALNKLPDFSFSGCESLEYVQLNNKISTIGKNAFSGCSSLQSIDLAQVTSIERVAFYQSGLKSFDIIEGTTSVYDYTFAECQNLERVNIPQSVSFIDPTAFQNDSNLTLGVFLNSYAQQYAVDNQIPYVIIGGVKLGDVTGDDDVNVSDVTFIQRYLAELEDLENAFLDAADINGDGDVNISDATAIQMYLAEYEVPYPIGEVIA